MMNIRSFDSLGDLSRATAHALLQQVQEGARTIGLSGGSTPQPLYELLGHSPLRDAFAEFPITWVVVDERYVPISHPQSNAAMIERTLFAQGMPSSHRFLRFRTELNDPELTAKTFADEWQAMGLTKLDIATLGMGDDGHTASIFADSPLLDFDPRIAAAVFVPKMHMWRVTLTMQVLRAATLRYVLATGAAKKPLIAETRAGATYPIARATAGVETWWFLDRAAAPE